MNRSICHFINTFFILSVLYYIFLLVSYSNRGFDITDESYYILRAAYATIYTSDYTNYGIFTGFLYSIANDNIVGFRILGFLTVLSAAFFSSFHFIQFFSNRLISHPYDFKRKIFISAILAAGILSYYFTAWLITPSYNLLMLFGSLLAFGGVFWFLSDVKSDSKLRSQLLPGLLIGTGSFLMANGNPLAALILSLIAYCIILIFGNSIKRRFTILLIIVPVVLIQFLSYIYLASGTFSNYIENVYLGLELTSIMESGHSLGSVFRRILDSTLSLVNPIPFIRHSYLYLTMILLSILTLKYAPKQYFEERERYLNILLFTIFSIYIFSHFNNLRFYGIEIIYIIFVLIISIFLKEIIFHKKSYKAFLIDFRSTFFLVVLLCSTAFFIRLGTNNDLISASFAGAYYYFIAIFLLSHALFKLKHKLADYFSFLILMGVIFNIQSASFQSPYRLISSLSEQTYPIKIMNNPSILYVDQPTSKWASTLQNDAVSAGWEAGSYLIDFTGATPGAAVVLGAIAPGRAWIIGSYKGSDEYAYRVLSQVDQNILENSWILTAPEGDRKISDEVIQKLGIRLNDNYVRVSEAYSGYRNERQILWKPGE